MGSFTKKYIRAFHPEDYLYLSWDIGYKNVAIYDGKRLVKQFEKSNQFTRGVTFQGDKLGKIKIKFTDTKPLQLEIKVNGKKYKPIKKGKQEVDLSSVVALYWVLMVLNVVALIFNSVLAFNSDFYDFSLEDHGFLSLSAIIYFLSAFLLARNIFWAYYLGFFFFMLINAVYVFLALEFGFDFFNGVKIIVRLLMLTYLIINLRKLHFVMNNLGDRKNNTIIDDPI